MIPLYSTKQVREIDDFAINKIGIPGPVLMENAAINICHSILSNLQSDKTALKFGILCGKGNNGGDGFALGRQLSNLGHKVSFIYLGSENELSDDCKLNFRIVKNISRSNKNISLKRYTSVSSINTLKNCDVIVDALLGTGVTGNLREPYESIIEKVNKFKSYKVAVDISSGLDADTGFTKLAFKADLTVTLAALKPGLFFGDGFDVSGKVTQGGIGIDDNWFTKKKTNTYLIEPEDALNFLPKKDSSLHKYSAGKVLTIAGSGSLPGAAVLTAKAAMRAGAGASILAFPNSIKSSVHRKLNEVVVHPYNDENEILSGSNIEELNEKINWADVVAIGPGLGREKKTIEAVRKFFKEKKFKFALIDADALYAIGKGYYKKLNLKNTVLTPHYGEFAHLFNIKTDELKKDLLKYGRKFVKETNAYLILKGNRSIIFTPTGDALINTTGNAGMAKFGTGDVLTGFLAGFISQSNRLEEAIISAVYLHSLSADLLVKRETKYGILASQISDNLPISIKFLRKSIV